MNDFLQQTMWRFIDQSISANKRSPLESFAMDDTLCHLVGQKMTNSTIRTWVHHDAVVLGIQDHRLPYIEQGMETLKNSGYDPIVRNSGGLAVVLDAGVLNISIVLNDDKPLSINNAFEMMVALIRQLFPEIAMKIEAYEIVGSYCPGSYDLSINGQKFAGISQRRMKNGIAVQIYLCVEGSGSERAELIKRFYENGLQGEKTKFEYPDIKPEVMASLQQLTGQNVTVFEVNERLRNLLRQWNGQLFELPLQQEEMELYDYYLERVFKRNESMLSK
ncbi:biotin/lipoate A/B protein ligase family protein [Solibacillus sp. FSL K6-1781]|uniref:Octanoyl-[GcvH]:protein N-octanoyltransferase n=1 Tax=Solibacillus isronensis B3W22 TaxID=1224748 RepID=K1L1X2_9BACL|nr:biotin/lipoate A/B protein ligase family protein [Solibacillus isronensis]AMO84239.1 octanoyltransferase [Solibacillus silvestris]EKB46132.1 Octanoyl-[GcvH]:protein N-octanoyltransferase [Solibacillus isronensis B3W22]